MDQKKSYSQYISVDPTKRLQDSQTQPWKHGFGPLLRYLSARRQDQPVIGYAQRPSQESFRLGQQANLSFASREIASVSQRNEQWLIKLFSLGTLGSNGVLPLHFTELVRERSEAKMDNTLANFLDMFHHRWLTHMYRAWAQAQSAAGLDRTDTETFSRYIARIGGDEPDEVQESALSPHARWASVAHRVRSARNPDGLVSTLQRYFGVNVALREYCLAWMPIEEQDQCTLAKAGMSAMLGRGAMLGEVVPDRQTRFRLIIGPLSLSSYLRLTPQCHQRGSDMEALVDLVRAFIGFEYIWEVELLVHAEAAPPAQLGNDAQLGWSTWMGANSDLGTRTITGMIFEPENYIAVMKDKKSRTTMRQA